MLLVAKRQLFSERPDEWAMPLSLPDFVRSDRLPSLPQVVVRVIELAREPEPDFDEVTVALRSDPALSARILKTANSALFALNQPVQSIEAAVPVLGMTTLRTIALGFTLADHRSSNRDAQDASKTLWRSSLTQAVFAELIAAESEGADPSTWFLAGLLQDIGILAALHTDTETYLTNVWDESEFPNVTHAERMHYGFTHMDIARELSERWGLPPQVRDAMCVHHAHMHTDDAAFRTPLATALQAANLCALYVVNHRRGGRALEHLVGFLCDHYGWTVDQAESAIQETSLRVGEAAALFSFDVGASYSPQHILSDARDLLEQIALTGQIEQRAAAASEQQTSDQNDALFDPMTGVYNRRFMDRVLNRQIVEQIRNRKPLGLLFLDVDRFKSINDEHGHQSGDEAICLVARVLTDTVRKSDSVIRYGGDEFLVVLPDASVDTVQGISERIRAGIAGSELPDVAARMTTSVGAVHYQPQAEDSLDANWLIDCVDGAMYEAKRNGGDQVHLRHVPGCREPVTA